MDDLTPDYGDPSTFCCQNPACDDQGKREAGNFIVCDRIGRDGQCRLLRCRACERRFSERVGTVFCGARLPPARVASILAHVQEGCGMRPTGRLVGTVGGAGREVAGWARQSVAGPNIIGRPGQAGACGSTGDGWP